MPFPDVASLIRATMASHLLQLVMLRIIRIARGLAAVERKRAGKFSLGMTQRLGIAAALLGDPGVLLFDEPINGLDPEGILWVRTLLKRLAAEGRAVFVSSHLMSEMALTADHLVVIGRGRLIADQPMAEFVAQSSRASVRVRTPTPEPLTTALVEAGARFINVYFAPSIGGRKNSGEGIKLPG